MPIGILPTLRPRRRRSRLYNTARFNAYRHSPYVETLYLTDPRLPQYQSFNAYRHSPYVETTGRLRPSAAAWTFQCLSAFSLR